MSSLTPLLSRLTARPIVKICGLASARDAVFCAQMGADLVGFVFHPQSPRYVAPALAREFNTPGRLRVGVFVSQGAPEILAAMAEAQLDLAQLHGDQGVDVARAIGAERSVRVFWPERDLSQPGQLAKDLELWSGEAALFLFDAGYEAGGHGRKLAGPAFKSPRPYLLAGGLTPSDLGRLWPAVDQNLVGFDFNSGVESSPGRKDWAAVRNLMEARAALA
jgi:phosphoribosylanthranilate isomerase